MDVLAFHAQRLATGARIAPVAPRDRGAPPATSGVDDMFAAIEDEQNPSACQERREIWQRILRLYRDAQHSGYSARDRVASVTPPRSMK